MTLPIQGGSPVLGANLPLELVSLFAIDRNGVNSSVIRMSLHCGTHIDAPSHIIDGGKGISDYSPSRFVGPAAILNLAEKRTLEKVDLESVSSVEERLGGARKLLIRTDWSDHWESDRYLKDFPRLTPEAARFLSETNIDLLGVDTPSVGSGPEGIAAHKYLLEKDILILEGLTALKSVEQYISTLVVLPINLKNVEAAPARALALVGP